MWDEQVSFQKNFFDPESMTEEEKIRFTKENILALHRELGEVLNEIPWKIHRANEKNYDLENIQEELIDCFKFFMNVCIIWGMTPETFVEVFMKKSEIVKQRYQNEKDRL
jgi:dimeric dUTPase (all-alpha-NTP-PPase superfamily)